MIAQRINQYDSNENAELVFNDNKKPCRVVQRVKHRKRHKINETPRTSNGENIDTDIYDEPHCKTIRSDITDCKGTSKRNDISNLSLSDIKMTGNFVNSADLSLQRLQTQILNSSNILSSTLNSGHKMNTTKHKAHVNQKVQFATSILVIEQEETKLEDKTQ